MQQRYKQPGNQPRRLEQWVRFFLSFCFTCQGSESIIDGSKHVNCSLSFYSTCFWRTVFFFSLSVILPPFHPHSILIFPPSSPLSRWRWWQQAWNERRASNGHWRTDGWDFGSWLLWLTSSHSKSKCKASFLFNQIKLYSQSPPLQAFLLQNFLDSDSFSFDNLSFVQYLKSFVGAVCKNNRLHWVRGQWMILHLQLESYHLDPLLQNLRQKWHIHPFWIMVFFKVFISV